MRLCSKKGGLTRRGLICGRRVGRVVLSSELGGETRRARLEVGHKGRITDAVRVCCARCGGAGLFNGGGTRISTAIEEDVR